ARFGQELRVRDVLEAGLVRAVHDLVDDEVARRAVVDAGGVDRDRRDRAVADEPLGGLLREAGEVEVPGVAVLGRPQVAPLVGPARAPAAPHEDDRAVGDAAVLLLPRLEVAHLHAIVAIALGGSAHVDDGYRRDERGQRHAVGGVLPLREVAGRVHVRAAVLRGPEAVRGVEPAPLRRAVVLLLELEAVLRRPVDGALVERVRQVDDLPGVDGGDERRTGRRATGRARVPLGGTRVCGERDRER